MEQNGTPMPPPTIGGQSLCCVQVREQTVETSPGAAGMQAADAPHWIVLEQRR